MNALNLQVQRELGAAAAEERNRAGRRRRRDRLWRREGVRGRCRHQADADDVPVDMVRASHGLQDFTRALAGIPKPTVAAITDTRSGVGASRPRLRLPHRRRQRHPRSARDPPQGSSPAPAGPNASPASWGRRGEGPRLQRPVRQDRRALAIRSRRRNAPADQVYAVARQRMARYVRGPAIAIRAAKGDRQGARRRSADWPGDRGACSSALFATDDRSAGMTSFVEGPRKASFTGR